MAIYYFDTHDGARARLDREGIELASWGEAGKVALGRVDTLSRDMPGAGSKVVSCTIRTADGASACRITLTMCARATDGS